MASLDTYTLEQLRQGARFVGIPVSNKTKQQLLEALLDHIQQKRRSATPSEVKVATGSKPAASGYFSTQSPLDEKQQKYCRCLMHVAAQQPAWCLREKAWRQTRSGVGCYNPYAVCTASVKRQGTVECSGNFDFARVPDNELVAYALLFHDQVLAANGWQELPAPGVAGWRARLERGLQAWAATKR